MSICSCIGINLLVSNQQTELYQWYGAKVAQMLSNPSRRPSVRHTAILYQNGYRGVGLQGDKGDMSPCQIPNAEFFSLNSAEFVTLSRIFSRFIGFWGFAPRPHLGL